MRISDWSSDVCSSDLIEPAFTGLVGHRPYSLQIACPAMAMPSAGRRTAKNAGERGGQRDSTGVERPQRSEARPRLIPVRGRGGRTRLTPSTKPRGLSSGLWRNATLSRKDARVGENEEVS